jgi:DNA-3-methyladenine glycosylase I
MIRNSSNREHRCEWAGSDPLYIEYHDTEWGVPVRNDTTLFEFLTLESAQAGLSWITILRKRENYRKAFANFDPKKVADYTGDDIETLMLNTGIIRNRLKILAAVNNAQRFLEVQKEFGSFAAYQWKFVGNVPVQNKWTATSQIPAISSESEAFSKDLKKRGFKFVGPTTIYAHMQATGMVNDHTIDCFRYKVVS